MFQTNTIQITPEILALVARIDEFKGAWRALGTLAPERLSALRRIATIESIGSSTRIVRIPTIVTAHTDERDRCSVRASVVFRV